MCAAIALGDIVGKTQHVFMVAVIPRQGALNRHVILFDLNGDRFRQHGLLGPVEILHECRNTTFVMQVNRFGFRTAIVGHIDEHT